MHLCAFELLTVENRMKTKLKELVSGLAMLSELVKEGYEADLQQKQEHS